MGTGARALPAAMLYSTKRMEKCSEIAVGDRPQQLLKHAPALGLYDVRRRAHARQQAFGYLEAFLHARMLQVAAQVDYGIRLVGRLGAPPNKFVVVELRQ